MLFQRGKDIGLDVGEDQSFSFSVRASLADLRNAWTVSTHRKKLKILVNASSRILATRPGTPSGPAVFHGLALQFSVGVGDPACSVVVIFISGVWLLQ